MGQTHGKARARHGEQEEQLQPFPNHHPGSRSPSVPGSPITYSPQLATEPFAKQFENSAGGYGHSEFAGWAAQPKLVPTVCVWGHGGGHVELEGSFDNWTQRHLMQRSGKDFTLVKLLPPGVYQYKFIVDGQWRHDPNLPSMYDEQGNINNVLEVQEYVAENLTSLSGFEPPPSPPSSYNSPAPSAEDFLKEPPVMPPQLQLSLLNVPPALDAIAALPRPQHVVLNHVYLQRATSSTNAAVLGTTHRFRSKYITSILYKPRRRAAPQQQQQQQQQQQPQMSDVSMGQTAGGMSQTAPMMT